MQNRFQLGKTTLFLFIALSVHQVSAAGNTSEQDFLQEFPIVLSASRLSQPLSEAPNAMTVIDRAMIKASGFRTIADLFRLVPGMYVGYKDGHSPIVAYHGAMDEYSRQMQVLIDGRSVYLPPTSSVTWEAIPLQIDDIERIEVVRGPAAASHGANSVQGVVNIITRDASDMNGTSVSAVTGSDGVADVSLHHGKVGANLDYRATLAYRADDGYATNALNDDHATSLANLRANYHPNLSDSVDIQLGYNQSKGAMGIAGRSTDLFRDTRAFSSFQQVTWLHTKSVQDEIKLNYYRIHRDYSDELTDESHLVNRHEIELQHNRNLGANNRLVYGIGRRSDSAESPLALAAPQYLLQSRLFAHDEWRMVDSTILNVGAMLENDGMGHQNTSPRIALSHHLSPQNTVRVSTSVAYRSPATLEEKANYKSGYLLAMGGVRPEKMHSKEIGYLGEFNKIGLSIDARAYFDQVSDMIFFDPAPVGLPPLSPDGKPYSFTNLLSAAYRGIEGTVKYHWGEKNAVTFNYSRQISSCAITGNLREPLFMPKLQEIVASCATRVPRNSGNILLSQQLSHDVDFSAGYYYQGELQFIDTPVPLSVMRRLDLRVGKKLSSSGQRGGEIALVVQNAFQNNFAEYAAVKQTANKILFNRRAYLTATFNF